MSSEQPHSPARHYAFVAAKLVVSVVLLWWLFTKIDVGRLWAGARNASLAWLAVAMGIYAINVLASAWRWHVLLSAQGVKIP